MEARIRHIPVMVREVVDFLVTDREGAYLDGTLGCAGHARALLEALGPSAVLVALDVDEASLKTAEDRLRDYRDRVRLFRASYADMEPVLAQAGIEAVDGILFDLGLSSEQLDDPSRGFAHSLDGPLDMRFDVSRGRTAAELLNSLSRRELTRLFREYGELRRPGAISGAIERARAARPLRTTGDLVRALSGVTMRGPARQRQLAQVFQALRLAVTRELEELGRGLEAARRCLKPGGVLVVISYHSLEDRKVKRFLREDKASWEILTRKPLSPSQAETAGNPRARSAKLRAAVRKTPAGGGRKT